MMTHGRALWACGALVLAAATFHCDVGIERGYATPDLSADSDYDLGPPPDQTALPAPTITALAPPLGSNAGGTKLTITGSGFQAGAEVTVAGAPCSAVTIVGPTSINCTTPARPLSCGAANVVVTNPDAQSASSDLFAYGPRTLTFLPGTSIPNGAASRSAVFADFDGDGNNDVANLSAAVAGVAAVAVHLGKGDGTFAATRNTQLAAGQDPAAMAVGDLNADGAPDLVVILNASSTAPLLLALLGQKDGTFKQVSGGPVTLTKSSAPAAVAIAAADNKTKPYVVVAGTVGSKASIDVLQSDGAGSLSMLTQAPVAGGLTGASHLALADLYGN